MSKKFEGIDLSPEELAQIGICSERCPGSGTMHYRTEAGGRRYCVYLHNEDGKGPIKSVSVDLTDPFGDGFPQKGFADVPHCDRHYMAFRLAHEVARNLVECPTVSDKISFQTNQGWGGNDTVNHCVQFKSRTDSAEDIKALVQAVRVFDQAVHSWKFKEAVANLLDGFRDDIKSFSNLNHGMIITKLKNFSRHPTLM
jgi:hypothetical protein